VVVVLAVVLGGLFFAGQWYAKRAEQQKNEPTAVRIEPVTRGDVVEIVSAPGEVEAETKVSISAKVAARVIELPFKEGDKVTKGDPTANPPIPPSVLVRLDDRDLRANLRSTEARRDAQKAQIDVTRARIAGSTQGLQKLTAMLGEAQRDLDRKGKLRASGDVSQADLDTAQTKVTQLESELASAKDNLRAEEAELIVSEHQIKAADAEIQRAMDDLSYTTITSPIDGVIIRRNAEVGELVVTGTMNNAGTVIMEVADLSRMLVIARVDETAIAQVELNQKAHVRMEAHRDKVFDGTVITVPLANADEQTNRNQRNNTGEKYFKTEILLDTGGKRILSGLTADVDIEVKRHEKQLKLPSQAVLGRAIDSLPEDMRSSPLVDRKKAMATVVYRLIDGKAIVTPVTIGASDMTHTIITTGLKEGESVIIGPYKVLEALQHDQKVKDEKAATQPATQPASKPAE
jgi:HlyD family secretion protein